MGRVKQAWLEELSEPIYSGNIDKCVCSTHFDDYYLKQFINKGDDGVCSYCRKPTKVIHFSSFMDMVKEKLYHRITPLEDANLPTANSYYDDADEEIPGFKRVGCYIAPSEAEYYESPDEIFEQYGLCSDNDELNDDMLSCFNHDEWIRGELFAEDLEVGISRAWKNFVKIVTHRKRYTFFDDSEFKSHEIWDDDVLTKIKDICSKVLLKDIKASTKLFRGRPSDRDIPEVRFKDLTSAPDNKAKENRMSAAGISVFYGALDANTVIQEIRHYSSQKIYCGEFETTTPLKVVDMCGIPNILSFWMPKHYEEYKFLKMFHHEITKPSSPDESLRHLEYVPTQIFTEYIRYMTSQKIDGIIYKSSLTGGKNIVLFYNQKDSEKILELRSVSTDATC